MEKELANLKGIVEVQFDKMNKGLTTIEELMKTQTTLLEKMSVANKRIGQIEIDKKELEKGLLEEIKRIETERKEAEKCMLSKITELETKEALDQHLL